jgi:hypothetical protein
MVSFGSHYIDENGTKSPSIHCLFKIVPKIIFCFLHTSIYDIILTNTSSIGIKKI